LIAASAWRVELSSALRSATDAPRTPSSSEAVWPTAPLRIMASTTATEKGDRTPLPAGATSSNKRTENGGSAEA